MVKKNVLSISFLIAGLFLIAADSSSLPDNYWKQPAASKSSGLHDGWSDLEKDLRPEACAQCHDAQFQAWKGSFHAQAYSAGLIGQFPGMGGHEAGNNCLVCHAPLQEQKLKNNKDVMASLALKIRQPEGVNIHADLDSAKMPLRHTGVSCAVCHVRGMQRFGPPRSGSNKTGKIKTDVHGGFTASKEFENSQFCASCHQFPQSRAINGKPLENTVYEWQQSRFAAEGTTCQDCHMPRRRHEFKGIHDVKMVRSGLDIKVAMHKGVAQLSLKSVRIGHAFPTYVTPKVLVQAVALDKKGRELHDWTWEIVREVRYNRGWEEVRDTRLMPDELRYFKAKQAPVKTKSVRFTIRVMPDAFYRGVYTSLLQGRQSEEAESLLKTALKKASNSEFTLFEEVVVIK